MECMANGETMGVAQPGDETFHLSSVLGALQGVPTLTFEPQADRAHRRDPLDIPLIRSVIQLIGIGGAASDESCHRATK